MTWPVFERATSNELARTREEPRSVRCWRLQRARSSSAAQSEARDRDSGGSGNMRACRTFEPECSADSAPAFGSSFGARSWWPFSSSVAVAPGLTKPRRNRRDRLSLRESHSFESTRRCFETARAPRTGWATPFPARRRFRSGHSRLPCRVSLPIAVDSSLREPPPLRGFDGHSARSTFRRRFASAT